MGAIYTAFAPPSGLPTFAGGFSSKSRVLRLPLCVPPAPQEPRRSPRSWSSRSPSASARPRRSSASSTACCCGRCRTPMRTGSWPSSRSPRRARPSRLADPNFDDFRDQNRSFQAIAKYNDNVASVSGASQPTRTTVAQRLARLSQGLRRSADPRAGFQRRRREERAPAPTVLVSYGYWRQHLGSPRDLSQSHLKIDGAVYSVIGVLPAGFRFPADVDLWLPADLDGENPSRTSHNYSAVGRLRDGVTVEQANRDISAIARRIHDTSSEQGRLSPQGWNGRPAAGLDHGQGALAAAGPARRGGISAAGGVRERGESAAGAGVGERARARHSQRARRGARTADPSVPYRSVPALAGRRRPRRAGSARGRGGTGRAGAGKSAAARQRLDQHSGACVRVPAFHRGRRRPRRVHRRARDFRGPAQGPRGRRARTGGFARQPARWPGHRGGADRDHAGSRGRSGIARAQPDESARGESRVPRGQDRHDGRLASVGGRSQGKGRSGDFLFEPDRPAQADPGRAQGRRDERPADGRRPSRRDVSADDAG